MSQIQKYYNPDIDVMKAILVIGMIADHALMLLADEPTRRLTAEFKSTVDLVSFSGFLFSFGYVTWLSYVSKAATFNRVFSSILRPLIAYYISAFFYMLFVERSYESAEFAGILFFSKLAPFAEFMPAFSLMLALGILVRKPVARLLDYPYLFFMVVGALLLTSLLPTSWIQSPLLSLFIGSSKDVAASFPLMQYFPIYLMGMYFARYKIKPNLWIGIAGIAGFYLFKNHLGDITRFPPSLTWIVVSLFFAITWYAISRLLSRWPPINRLFVPIGANSLLYLLASNILIFAFRGAMPRLGGAMNLKVTLEVTIAILAVIYFLVQSMRRIDADKIAPTGTSESA